MVSATAVSGSARLQVSSSLALENVGVWRMTRLYLVKTGAGELVGWDQHDLAYLTKLGAGEPLECDTRKARHPEHHRKFFALLQQAFVNQEKYRNLTDLLIALKLKTGWYDEHITAEGKLVYVPKSISFARMGQEEFEAFYKAAIIALAELTDSEQVTAEADSIIAHDFAGQPLEDLPIG
jgi:hypothetical protein